jgi:hypothetical protein
VGGGYGVVVPVETKGWVGFPVPSGTVYYRYGMNGPEKHRNKPEVIRVTDATMVVVRNRPELLIRSGRSVSIRTARRDHLLYGDLESSLPVVNSR